MNNKKGFTDAEIQAAKWIKQQNEKRLVEKEWNNERCRRLPDDDNDTRRGSNRERFNNRDKNSFDDSIKHRMRRSNSSEYRSDRPRSRSRDYNNNYRRRSRSKSIDNNNNNNNTNDINRRSRSKSKEDNINYNRKDNNWHDNRNKFRSKSKSRDREINSAYWLHDKHKDINTDSPPTRNRQRDTDYRPPSPDWISRAGGVYIRKKYN